MRRAPEAGGSGSGDLEFVLSDARERAQRIIDESMERAREIVQRERATPAAMPPPSDPRAFEDLRRDLRGLVTEVHEIRQRLGRIEFLLRQSADASRAEAQRPEAREARSSSPPPPPPAPAPAAAPEAPPPIDQAPPEEPPAPPAEPVVPIRPWRDAASEAPAWRDDEGAPASSAASTPPPPPPPTSRGAFSVVPPWSPEPPEAPESPLPSEPPGAGRRSSADADEPTRPSSMSAPTSPEPSTDPLSPDEAPSEEEADPASRAAASTFAPEASTFAPEAGTLSLRVTPVAGFQGLMRVQDAVAQLPAVRYAGVEAYSQGEARLRIELAAAAVAEDFASGLAAALDTQAHVQEASIDTRELLITLR